MLIFNKESFLKDLDTLLPFSLKQLESNKLLDKLDDVLLQNSIQTSTIAKNIILSDSIASTLVFYLTNPHEIKINYLKNLIAAVCESQNKNFAYDLNPNYGCTVSLNTDSEKYFSETTFFFNQLVGKKIFTLALKEEKDLLIRDKLLEAIKVITNSLLPEENDHPTLKLPPVIGNFIGTINFFESYVRRI